MSNARIFLDTAFIQALLNRHDNLHNRAKTLLPVVQTAAEVWVTEAVLTEVGNALSSINRIGASQFISMCYETPNIKVVQITTTLLHQGLNLYSARADKEWGLTDCISFVVMKENGLYDAMTADKHFVQAGFVATMLVS